VSDPEINPATNPLIVSPSAPPVFHPTGQLIVAAAAGLVPARLFAPTAKAARRVAEFFTAQINNDHTRKAYLNAARRFAAWCEAHGLAELAAVQPIHVAAFIKELQGRFTPPTVKQHLAALRMLFDWLVTGHIIEVNPAHAVRGPKYVVKKGKTPVLNADEARALLDAIDSGTVTGLRDRALIGVMVYSFARVNAVIGMQVKDYFSQGRRGWVRLHEKGGKEHEVPCHHSLEKLLDDYIAAAESWTVERRVIARVEAGPQGADSRFIVTNLPGLPKSLYEKLYCARGQAENLIKAHKLHLASDRTSCRKATANQFRLLIHTAAYWLMLTLRGLAPRTSFWRDAQFDTIRLNLIKVAARVTEMVTRIKVALPSAFPYQAGFANLAARIAKLPP
jgi:site-specific recombinase XerC